MTLTTPSGQGHLAMELRHFKYQSLSGSSTIRLVTILPGERIAQLILELEHVDLDSASRYECLSYAWGQNDHDRPITVNNSSFLVSSTLHMALEHLRHEQRKRKIWIDAISINQADIDERSAQVAIMREIYQNATRVNIWLGPATESSEQAMTFLRMMATDGRRVSASSETISADEEWLSRPISQGSSSNAHTTLSDKALSKDQENGPTVSARLMRSSMTVVGFLIMQTFFREYSKAHAIKEATKNDFTVTGFPIHDSDHPHGKYFTNEWEPHWHALDELLARPWWGRTWIVQEVWCASEAVLWCGAATLRWKTFQKAMHYSEAWDDMGDALKGTRRAQHWEALRRRYTLAINLANERVNGRTLSTLLVNSWDRASTDPRDKVFAMLSLVGKNEDVSMVPNYKKSMGQVYREVARDIMVKQGQMDVLLAASGIAGSGDLPSWVPDWRCEAVAKKPALLVNRHLMMKLYFTDSMSQVVLNGHGYRAAGNSKAFASFSDDLDVLTVFSQQIGRVGEVCKADIATLRDEEFTDRTFDFILQSKFVSVKTQRREAYLRAQIDEQKDASILLATLTGGGKTKEDRWAPTMRNIMRRRRLFVSQNGDIGIGPSDAQAGDIVFIISGCNFPFVLRPSGDSFAVVGEAYIHGQMNGESLAGPWSRLWDVAWKEILLH
ncbi:heterokaryon incompatibility protein-domain-containing protein [Paraphoma chrysanthemicola]|nr:heterokaryon incompatibility protein-domain-containing protein [Paraphoma chrysanthemicola]